MKKVYIWLAVVSLALWGCSSAGAQTEQPEPTEAAQETAVQPSEEIEPISIRLGLQTFGSNLPLYIAVEEGYLTEAGLDVTVIPFATEDVLVALLAGEIDVSGSLYSVAQFRAITEGAGLKFVADKGSLDPDSCTYNAWMVRTEVYESGVLDDLSNMRDLIYSASAGGGAVFSNYAMERLVGSSGVDVDELELVALRQDLRLEAFRNGAIDIATSAEPWITRMVNEGVAQVWLPLEDYMPGEQLGMLWFGPTITEGNREAGNRFMVGYLKALRQYNEGLTDRNVELMAEFTGLDPEEVRTLCLQSIREDGSIDFQSLLDFQAWAVENGLLDEVVPVEEFWDGSFLDYAREHIDD